MTLDTLLAERDIQKALIKFARAMDDRDWSAIEALTTEEVTGEFGTGPLKGRSELVEHIRSYLDDCGPTQHLLGNFLIEVDGDSATSQAYVSDMHIGAGAKSDLTFRTLGDYHDRWRRVDDVWRMTHRQKLNHAHIGSLEIFGQTV